MNFNESFDRQEGRLHIVEPLPFGTMFDVVKLLEDETVVRTHSHKLLRTLGNLDVFELITQMDYVLVRQFSDFDAFLDHTVRPYHA